MAEGEELGLIDGTGSEEAEFDPELSSAEETESDQGTTGGEETDQGAAGDQGGQEETERQQQGPLTSKQVKADIARIKEIDPQMAKRYERAFFKVQHLDKLGKAADLASFKSAVEERGGIEKIREDYEELEASRQLEEGFAKGDPRIIEGWATDYPEGFKKLIVPALNQLEKMDGERYDAIGSSIATGIFERCGVFAVIGKIGEALTAGKPEDATKAYNDLVKFLGDMKGLAGRAKASPLTDREKDLEERESSLEERDSKTFYSSVRSEVNREVLGEMNRLLRASIKVRHVESGMANRVRREIVSELQRRINTNPDYQRRYKAVMGARNHDGSVKFIVSNAKEKLAKVIRDVLRYPEYQALTKPSQNGQRRTLGNAGGGSGSNSQVGKPKTSDVDFSRTDKAVWISSLQAGKATGPIYLNNGKLAKW